MSIECECCWRRARYAGWMGTVAARYIENGQLSNVLPSLDESRHRLAIVAGTSTCHIVQVSYLAQSIFIKTSTMLQSRDGVFVKGVWGPYRVYHCHSA
jgi:ribulose kinase